MANAINMNPARLIQRMATAAICMGLVYHYPQSGQEFFKSEGTFIDRTDAAK